VDEEKEREAKAAAEREAQQLQKMLAEEADEHFVDAVRLQAQAKYKEAIKMYKKAYETSEEHVGALFNCALLHERQNERKEARGLYERCSNICKSNPGLKTFAPKIAGYAGGA